MLPAVFNSLHPSITLAYSPYCSLYISYGIDMENLFNNQEFLECGVTIFLYSYNLYVRFSSDNV